MLSKFQKMCIDELVNTHTSGIVKDHKQIATFNFAFSKMQHFVESEAKEIKIPAFEDMFKKSLAQLKKLGFSVKHVPPKKANCIIAVYAHDGFEHMECEHWFYGTKVFFKSLRSTKSLDGIRLDDSSFKVDVWMFKDEKVTVVPRRAYYYLKIG